MIHACFLAFHIQNLKLFNFLDLFLPMYCCVVFLYFGQMNDRRAFVYVCVSASSMTASIWVTIAFCYCLFVSLCMIGLTEFI